jgi:type 1 glutamine amidotransferase
MTRRVPPLLLLTLVAACGGSPSSQPTPVPTAPAPLPVGSSVRVLMLTATAGFRHDSIPAARTVVSSLATQSGAFTVTATEDLHDVTASRLAATDVLMFALTTGELAFDADQKMAITRFVADGGGFIGIHSAADTLYQWPEYGQLVGAYFKEHPWTQTIGRGRAYYNALGHFEATWNDPWFRRQLAAAIQWTAGR